MLGLFVRLCREPRRTGGAGGREDSPPGLPPLFPLVVVCL